MPQPDDVTGNQYGDVVFAKPDTVMTGAVSASGVGQKVFIQSSAFSRNLNTGMSATDVIVVDIQLNRSRRIGCSPSDNVFTFTQRDSFLNILFGLRLQFADTWLVASRKIGRKFRCRLRFRVRRIGIGMDATVIMAAGTGQVTSIFGINRQNHPARRTDNPFGVDFPELRNQLPVIALRTFNDLAVSSFIHQKSGVTFRTSQ